MGLEAFVLCGVAERGVTHHLVDIYAEPNGDHTMYPTRTTHPVYTARSFTGGFRSKYEILGSFCSLLLSFVVSPFCILGFAKRKRENHLSWPAGVEAGAARPLLLRVKAVCILLTSGPTDACQCSCVRTDPGTCMHPWLESGSGTYVSFSKTTAVLEDTFCGPAPKEINARCWCASWRCAAHDAAPVNARCWCASWRCVARRCS